MFDPSAAAAKQQAPVKITLKTLEKGHLDYYADKGTLISALLTHDHIQRLQLSLTDDHDLFFGGQKLEDDRQLSHYGISDGSTILCEVRGETNCSEASYPTKFECKYVNSDDEDDSEVDDEVDDNNNSSNDRSGGTNGGKGGDDTYNSFDIEENNVAEGVYNNLDVVYFVYPVMDKEFSNKLHDAEQQHDGSAPFSTLLGRLTKIGRAASWDVFLAKIKNLRTWNNFATFRCVALSYNGNSVDAENALHFAYSTVWHAGEWFILNMIDRARIASLFERVAEKSGGTVRYFPTSRNLFCSFTPVAMDTNLGSQVYFAQYGLEERVLAVLDIMLNDNNTSNSVKEWCCRMKSFKIGCAIRSQNQQGPPARVRLFTMFWACGFIDTIRFRVKDTNHPKYDEKKEHIARNQDWTGYGEWFHVNDGEEQMVLERKKKRPVFFHDVGFYANLISTGFISRQTIRNLASAGRLTEL